MLLQKTAFFRLAPFYQPQKSVQPERSRKHNFKLKICFFLLDRVSFFSSTPQNSEQAPHFQSQAPHSLLLTPQSKRKTTPSQSSCDFVLVSINFCVATQKAFEFCARCTDSEAFSYPKQPLFCCFCTIGSFLLRSLNFASPFFYEFSTNLFRNSLKTRSERRWNEPIFSLFSAVLSRKFFIAPASLCSIYGN